MAFLPYTDASLRTYLVARLGEVATILGWDFQTQQIVEAATDTLLAYGTDDVTTITLAPDLAKLRAYAAVMAWRAAVQSLAARYDVGADTFRNSRSQMHQMALENLARAESDAATWGANVGAVVGVQHPRYIDDPYAWIPEDLQTVPL